MMKNDKFMNLIEYDSVWTVFYVYFLLELNELTRILEEYFLMYGLFAILVVIMVSPNMCIDYRV